MKKVVLITGANKGIGFETARLLVKLGYYVYIGSREKSKGRNAVRRVKDLGLTDIDCIEIDVTSSQSIKSARLQFERKSQKLDVLINNAGIAGEQPQNISTGNIDNLRNVFETNFFGAVQTTQAFIDLLIKSEQPKIVNVSSQLASLTFHLKSQNPSHRIYDAYSCSKTALNAFTVMLAKEFADSNFTIISVEPGYTATDLNQFKGMQTTEQAAENIVKYVTTDDKGTTGKYFNKEGEMDW